MSGEALAPDRLDTVMQLATTLAERMMQEDPPLGAEDRTNVVALLRAALLLEEHGYPIPPAVVETLASAEGLSDGGAAAAESDEAASPAQPPPIVDPDEDQWVPAA